MRNMLRANTVIVLLEWLDDAERCYREGIPKSGTEYIGLVRRYLREAAVSDVEVEPIPAPDAPVEV